MFRENWSKIQNMAIKFVDDKPQVDLDAAVIRDFRYKRTIKDTLSATLQRNEILRKKGELPPCRRLDCKTLWDDPAPPFQRIAQKMFRHKHNISKEVPDTEVNDKIKRHELAKKAVDKVLRVRPDLVDCVKPYNEEEIYERRYRRVKQKYEDLPLRYKYNTKIKLRDLIYQVRVCAENSEDSESLYGSSIGSDISSTHEERKIQAYRRMSLKEMRNDPYTPVFNSRSLEGKMLKEAKKRLKYRQQKDERTGRQPRARNPLVVNPTLLNKQRSLSPFEDFSPTPSEVTLMKTLRRNVENFYSIEDGWFPVLDKLKIQFEPRMKNKRKKTLSETTVGSTKSGKSEPKL